jgi:hypothetical protein
LIERKGIHLNATVCGNEARLGLRLR